MTEIADIKPLAGRLALVTGASRGIGRAVALAYARAGADIIAVARNRSQGALEALDDDIRALGQNCTIAPLDLRQGDMIDRLGGMIFERWQKLDILVANAGLLGPISPLTHISPKEWAEVFDVNVTSVWRLIRSLDLLLKQSDAGRAIFLTSGAAHKNRPHWGLYGASKAAVEHMAKSYAAECAITSIKANIVNPGPIRTHMRAQAVPGEDPATLPTPEAIAPLFVDLASPACERHGELVDFYQWANIKR